MENNPNTPCSNGISETQESFAIPKIKKQLITRAKRLEQFFWQEFYDEYVRNQERMQNAKMPKDNTEYFDEYCKHMPAEDSERKESLANKYPLYCTTPITLWNHQGDPTKTFRKKYSITRPVHECTEKFAD